MIIGPKYKIARRLGAPIFEKTQTQKYAMRLERKSKTRGFSKQKTEFGMQFNEKQKARFTYAISEKQFSKYIKEALIEKNSHPTQTVFESLEMRLDNIVYRIGFSSTRLGARQMVSHGHIMVNGKRVTIPSMRLRLKDKVSIRSGSSQKVLFANLTERMATVTTPAWISFNAKDMSAEVVGLPQFVGSDNMFDLNTVIEFYSR